MNNFAITSGGLGDIIERGGAAMATANTSLEKTLALGTSGNEILNNPERVGNGLKTLALRLRGSSTELQEAGEEVDEFVTSTSKMQGLIKTLTGVDIMRSATEYKDVYEILDEIALVYNDLTDINKASLTEAMFGKHQANLGTAILTNFQTARNVLEELTSGAATGSATKEYEKWLDSLEAKLGKLGSTFERASIAIFDDNTLGDAIDSLSSILSLVVGIAETVGSIPSLAGIAGAIFGGVMPDFAPFSINKDTGSFETIFNYFPRMRDEMKNTLANDLEVMKQYADLTDVGDELVKKQNALKTKLSDSARIAVMTPGFNREDLSKYHKEQQEIINQQKLGVKVTNAWRTVMNSVLSIGTSMLASATIGFGLELFVKWIEDAVYKTENLLEKSQELKDSWSASRKELDSNKKVLDQYGERFAVLSQGVTPSGVNRSLGTEEYAEYLSIRDQIASSFPELIRGYDAEGNALLNLSGNVQSVTNALNEAYEAQVRQQRFQEQNDFFSTVGKASYTEVYGEGSWWPWREFSGGVAKHIQNAQALLSFLSDEESAYGNLEKAVNAYRNNGIESITVEGWDDRGPNFKELMEAIEYSDAFNEIGAIKIGRNFEKDAPEVITKLLSEYIKSLTQSVEMQEWQAEGRRFLETEFDKGGLLQKLDESTKATLLPIFDYLNDPEWYAQFGGNVNAFHAYLTEHLLTPLKDKNAQNAIGELFAAEDEWLTGKSTRNDYETRLSNQLKVLEKMGEFGAALYDSILDDDFDAKLTHSAEALGVTVEAAKELLTLPQIDWIDRNVESGTAITYAEVIAGLETEAERAAVAIDSLTESYTKFTEARAAAQTALSSLSEKGYLTPEETQQISDAGYSGAVKRTSYGSAYVDYQSMRELDKALTQSEIDKQLEAIAFKTEEVETAYNALYEAQEKGNLVELLNQQSIIDARAKEIEQIKSLVSALEGSTSALSAFKQAASLGELGDNFRDTKEAIDVLEQGLESGRVGTNKFSAAIELIFGEQALANFKSEKLSKEALKKDVQAAKKFYTEDGDLNLSAAMEALVKAGIGRYVERGGKRVFQTADVSKEEYQEAFGGVSLEFARAIVDNMNEFAQSEADKIGWLDDSSKTKQAEDALEHVQKMAVQASTVTINAAKIDTGEVETPPAEAVNTEAVNAEEYAAKIEKILGAVQIAPQAEKTEVETPLFELPTDKRSDMRTAWEDEKEKQRRAKLEAEKIAEAEKLRILSGDVDVHDALDIPQTASENIETLGSNAAVAAEAISAITASIMNDKYGDPNNPPKLDYSYEDQLKLASGSEGLGELLAEQVAEDYKIAMQMAEEAVTAATDKQQDVLRKYSPLGIPTSEAMKRATADLMMKEFANTQTQLDVDTQKAEESINEAKTEAEQPVTTPVEADTSNFDKDVENSKSNAARPVTVPMIFAAPSNGVPAGINAYGAGGASPNTTAVSKVDGGVAYVNGNTLVGELAPEIIVDRKTGTWSLAEYPQLRHLNAGDIVFNGQQTKAILSGRRTDFSKTVGGNSNVDGTGGPSYAFGIGGRANQTAVNDSTKLDVKAWLKLHDALKYIGGLDVTDGASGGNGSGGGGSSGGGDAEEEEKEWYDWIVKALELAKKATEKAIEDVAEKVGHIAQNAQLTSAIKKNQSEIEKNQAAADRYLQHADLIASRNGLSSSMVQDIQNGKIDITEYDKDMVEKINEYSEWYEKVVQCQDAIEELKKQELDLQRQKLDNIEKYYNFRLERLEAELSLNTAKLDKKGAYGEEIVQQDYVDAIKATQEKITQLEAERKAYAEQFDALVESGVLEPDSTKWHEYVAILEDVDENIVETQTDLSNLIDEMENIELTNLEYAFARLEAFQNAVEAFQGFHDAQGVENVADSYVDLIENGFKEIENLEKQNEFLLGQQEGLDVLSEKWQELQSQIEDNEGVIWDIKSAQEQWNDAIADLQIERLQKERDMLEETNDELERRKDMEQALEDLEKARTQRTKLIYRQNVGFVYEADQDAIKEAQDRVDELRHNETIHKIDEVIEVIEENKKNDNIYDYEGIDVLKNFAVSGDELYNYAHMVTELDRLLADRMVEAQNAISTTNADNAPVTISIGDVVLENISNADDLAQRIVNELPNRIIQRLYNNK